MTIKELKKVIKDLPDDALVSITGDDGYDNTIEENAMGAVYEEETQQLYITY